MLIGLKGTSSAGDLMTDLIATAVPKSLNGGCEAFVHEGMDVAATQVCNDVMGVLQNLFLPQGYEILVTGHSLGAGTASLLGLTLRERLCEAPTPWWWRFRVNRGGKSVCRYASQVRVLAFATPPVMDLATAKSCECFITSVVNHGDVIPRSSVVNIVMMMMTVSEIDILLRNTGITETFNLTSEEAEALLQRAVKNTPQEAASSLFVPGKVVLLSDNERGEQQAALTDGGDLSLRSIHFQSSMVTDHLGAPYRESLFRAVEGNTKEISLKK